MRVFIDDGIASAKLAFLDLRRIKFVFDIDFWDLELAKGPLDALIVNLHFASPFSLIAAIARSVISNAS